LRGNAGQPELELEILAFEFQSTPGGEGGDAWMTFCRHEPLGYVFLSDGGYSNELTWTSS
jgi:hypothetical protein